LPPIQFVDAPDELGLELELDAEPVLPEEEDDEEPLSPPPLGTAEPTPSPPDGRDSPWLGRSRSCAQAGERLTVNAAATSPIESF
jgi:hypothetical protein